MTVQKHIEELRRLGEMVAPVSGRAKIVSQMDTYNFCTATRNLLPVLLAAWELAEAEQCYREHVTGEKGWGDESPAWDDQQMELSRILKAARKSYREALKGVEDE